MKSMPIFLLWFFVFCVSVHAEVQCTEPVLLTELNSTYNAEYPHLARDGVTLYFGRKDENGLRRLYTATRDLDTGVFSNITPVEGLAAGANLYTPWISDDGLRLYYGIYSEAIRLYQAERDTISDPWTPMLYFGGIHQNGRNDAFPSLTSDELTMYYGSARTKSSSNDLRIWKTTRQSVHEQFSNPVQVEELDAGYVTSSPCILPDGLTIYFAEITNNQHDLYRATRDFPDEPFSNIEPLSVNTQTGREGFPYVTPDESEIFFWSEEGIWNARIIQDPRRESMKQIRIAIRHDQEALAEIELALDAKYAASKELETLLKTAGKKCALTRRDVLLSYAKLRIAILFEEKSKRDIVKSLESLEGTLALLSRRPVRNKR